jgi:hypothetical protein
MKILHSVLIHICCRNVFLTFWVDPKYNFFPKLRNFDLIFKIKYEIKLLQNIFLIFLVTRITIIAIIRYFVVAANTS